MIGNALVGNLPTVQENHYDRIGRQQAANHEVLNTLLQDTDIVNNPEGLRSVHRFSFPERLRAELFVPGAKFASSICLAVIPGFGYEDYSNLLSVIAVPEINRHDLPHVVTMEREACIDSTGAPAILQRVYIGEDPNRGNLLCTTRAVFTQSAVGVVTYHNPLPNWLKSVGAMQNSYQSSIIPNINLEDPVNPIDLVHGAVNVYDFFQRKFIR